MKQNVVIYGTAVGSYRTQNLFKVLSENKHINAFFLNYEQFWTKSEVMFTLQQRFVEIMFLMKSDIVIIPAMRHSYTYKYKLAKLLKKKIITDFYISFYDTFVLDSKTLLDSSNEAKNTFSSDRQAILLSDCVIFLNQAEADYYSSMLNISLSSINYKIIPICVDGRLIAQQQFANGKRSKFTICWWGTYINLHGLDKIIDACKILSDSGIEFEFYIFGENEEKSHPFKEKIDQLGLEQLIHINNTKSFNNGELEPFLLDQCDLALGHFGDSDKAKTVFTNKIADAFAMGLPVLSMKTRAMDTLLSAALSEIFICDNYPSAIAASITAIMSDRSRLLEVSAQAFARYKEQFSYFAFRSRIDSLLKDL